MPGYLGGQFPFNSSDASGPGLQWPKSVPRWLRGLLQVLLTQVEASAHASSFFPAGCPKNCMPTMKEARQWHQLPQHFSTVEPYLLDPRTRLAAGKPAVQLVSPLPGAVADLNQVC